MLQHKSIGTSSLLWYQLVRLLLKGMLVIPACVATEVALHPTSYQPLHVDTAVSCGDVTPAHLVSHSTLISLPKPDLTQSIPAALCSLLEAALPPS